MQIQMQMQIINNQTVKFLIIKPNHIIEQFTLSFDLDQKLSKKITFEMVRSNMDQKCNCKYYVKNIAKAQYPDQTFYIAFYESNNESSGMKFNKTASKLLNNVYNTDNDHGDNYLNKCYGNCYILHFDPNFGELYDVGVETFIRLYNKVHTKDGQEERNYLNRIYKKPESNKYYSFKYKEKCLVM